MCSSSAQIWQNSRFTIERVTTNTQDAVFRFSGPFTARDMYSSMSPDAFHAILEPVSGDEQSAAQIFDLTDVPYMDSLGLGVLVRHHVRCQCKGIRLSITGMSPRVQELFRITKMENVLPIVEIKELN